MTKRLSTKQKDEITELFKLGKTLDQLSKHFNFTKLTISRNLRKIIGDKEYKVLTRKNKSSTKNNYEQIKNYSSTKENDNINEPSQYKNKEQPKLESQFIEVTPLIYEIEDNVQKDLSSMPLSDFNFPKTVYMIVDKKIELEIKTLREYPEWQFLSQEELNRKTIEIHVDLKIAKRLCNQEKKVIKVPNTDVFKIVAPILLKRGISRIVSTNNLIAL